jgi:hypothetical protein
MPTSALFQTPLPQRDRLIYLREFLAWLYDGREAGPRICLDFWAWWTGAPDKASPDYKEWRIEELVRDSSDWKWAELRRDLRNSFEKIYDSLKRDPPLFLSAAPFAFRSWRGRDGREYFSVNMALPEKLTAEAIGAFALEEVLRHLEGLAVEAIGRCARADCRRLFLRLRAKRRLYCSTRCRHRAVLDRREAPTKPSRKRSPKGASRGANPGA